MVRRPPRSTRTDTLCPYTTLFRSGQLGMALVTGAGREKDALSVGITFAMHGGVPQGKHGNDFQTGSSFSSAKAAAYGAYIISRHPDVSRDEVVELIKKGSRSEERRVGKECVRKCQSRGSPLD